MKRRRWNAVGRGKTEGLGNGRVKGKDVPEKHNEHCVIIEVMEALDDCRKRNDSRNSEHVHISPRASYRLLINEMLCKFMFAVGSRYTTVDTRRSNFLHLRELHRTRETIKIMPQIQFSFEITKEVPLRLRYYVIAYSEPDSTR